MCIGETWNPSSESSWATHAGIYSQVRAYPNGSVVDGHKFECSLLDSYHYPGNGTPLFGADWRSTNACNPQPHGAGSYYVWIQPTTWSYEYLCSPGFCTKNIATSGLRWP